jgi:hypothetical protein
VSLALVCGRWNGRSLKMRWGVGDHSYVENLLGLGKERKEILDSRIIDGERIFLIAIRRSNGHIKSYQIEKENGMVIYKEACNIFKGYLNERKIQEIVRQNFKNNEGEL